MSRSAIDDRRRPRTCSGRLVGVVGDLVLGAGALRRAKHRPTSMGQKGALVSNSRRALQSHSYLCVRCKGKGATRAARAQCAHPVLSAKRRHQIHDVDHRDGGAEHLWQQRQSPHAVSIMIGNGRTAPTCQSGLAGRMGEWCMRRAHSMDCSHGTGPWHVPVGAEEEILGLRYALLVKDRPKVGGAGRYRVTFTMCSRSHS